MKKRRFLIICLVLCGIMVLMAAACLIVRGTMAKTQQSQMQAERWAGDSDMRFMQFTCFFTRDALKDLESVYALRQKFSDKFAEANVEAAPGGSLYCDAWSTTGSIKISSEHGNANTSVVAVGGSFFDFHPLTLCSGVYLRQNDLMKDRVVLDETLAWMLFGSPYVAGMQVEIDGELYVVSGVVQRESDAATKKFAEDGPMLYIPFESWLKHRSNAGIDCYEVVLAEPVDGFTQTVLEDNFSVGDGILQQNTDRFTLAASVRNMKKFGTRGTRTSAAILPYWENAARYVEDWCTLLAFLATLLLIFPAICALVAFVWGWIIVRKLLIKKVPGLVGKAGDKVYALSSKMYKGKHD
ncbi:MAG: ABC transporter permease [Oscillospiraceae bacterium]|nr:ABC transporter permease [Oscillospiraceae bacterium]